MPSQPCPNTVPCFPCLDDSPVLNLSAEAPDEPTHVAVVTVPTDPPIGTRWVVDGCLGICVSTVSLAEAVECARLQAELCAWDGGDGCSQGICDDDTRRAIFYSAPIICTVICPDGTSFQHTLPSGIVRSIYSQADADYRARIICLTQAATRRICILNDSTQALCHNTVFSQPFVAVGGQPPKTFSIVGGALPTGLTMTPAGVVSGAPTVAGPFTFTLLVQDSQAIPATAMKTFVWTVIEILPVTLPDATLSTPYAQALTETGGTPPETWAVTGGSLPPGMTLNPATGLLSGTPTSSGVFVFVVTMTDSAP